MNRTLVSVACATLFAATTLVSSVAEAQGRGPRRGGPPPASSPEAWVYWVHQSARARPDMVEELRSMRDDVVALRALAESTRGPNREAMMKRLRSMERRLASLADRLDGALPPTAFATMEAPFGPVLVPVPVEPPLVVQPEPEPALPILDDRTLRELTRQMKDTSFDSSRLDVLRAAIGEWLFRTDQVSPLLATFGFDSDRMRAAELLLPRVVDLDRAFRLMDAFSFDSDKRKLSGLIEQERSRR